MAKPDFLLRPTQRTEADPHKLSRNVVVACEALEALIIQGQQPCQSGIALCKPLMCIQDLLQLIQSMFRAAHVPVYGADCSLHPQRLRQQDLRSQSEV